MVVSKEEALASAADAPDYAPAVLSATAPCQTLAEASMQYHLNGFRPGAPDVAPALETSWRTGNRLPSEVDVLIVGCGPAGLTLAAQLSAFPDIKTCIVDQKPGPLEVGQADGIKPRTMEIFEAFSFSERVLRARPERVERLGHS